MGNRLPLLAGIGIVAVLIGGAFFVNRGSHVELKGSVLKVRTHEIESGSSLAVVDFRFVNPANYPFIVRQVDVIIEMPDGKVAEGMAVSELDARRLFGALPALGQKYNDSLKVRDKIAARSNEDRMVAARFEVPVSTLESRKSLMIRVQEVDGNVSEISEERAR